MAKPVPERSYSQGRISYKAARAAWDVLDNNLFAEQRKRYPDRMYPDNFYWSDNAQRFPGQP